MARGRQAARQREESRIGPQRDRRQHVPRWYVPFYFYGVIHGDPHLATTTVRPDNGINLLDFGCVRIFKPSFVKGVIDLYFALQRDDNALAVHAYEIWGFKESVEGDDRGAEPMGALRLRAAARRPQPQDPGEG